MIITDISKLRLGASLASLVGRSVCLQRKIDNETTTPVFNTKLKMNYQEQI